jgi:hypothetical protein
VVVVVCALLALLLSTVFAGASVVVYPQTREVTAPQTLSARINAAAGDLSYETMTIRRSATVTARASGTANVSRQASGVVTVFNAYSTAPQRLIANTRFEAPDGKIYRIRDSVTVPGGTTGLNGSITPGTITVTVYADSPGESYNREQSTRFTVPGFEGDPRFTKFYAESQGAISGGFVGVEPAVPAAELAQAEAALKLELDTALRAGALSELPQGYFPVEGTLTTSYSDIRKATRGSDAELSQSAIATAAIVRQNDLAAAVARETIGSDYRGEAVTFLNLEGVSLSSASSTSAEAPLTINFGGSLTLLWQFDPALLQQALIGQERSSLEAIIQSFSPAIVRADATIRPFWQGSFPDNPDKIQVTLAPTP